MVKNKLKLSLVATTIITTCTYAGVVTAPNIDKIEISGDMELKQVRQKSNNETIDYRTAEINLNLDAKMDNGLSVFTSFKAYDDTQGIEDDPTTPEKEGDTSVRLTHAYAVIPIMNAKGKIIAGLTPNILYGTEAFDNGAEDWKIALNMPIAKGVKVTVVSKIKKEEKADKNKGDSGASAIRLDAKVGSFMIGAKYAQGYQNKGDGFSPALLIDKEKKAKNFAAYLTGSIAGFDLGAEYMIKEITLVGVPAMFNQPPKQKGYYLSVGKEFGALSASIAYINLKDGMKGGEDFAPGLILDGNVDSAGRNLTTSAIVLPFTYTLNDQLSFNATYIDATIEQTATAKEDVREIDIGAEYAFNKNVSLSAVYGDYNSSVRNNDQKNFKLALAITF